MRGGQPPQLPSCPPTYESVSASDHHLPPFQTDGEDLFTLQGRVVYSSSHAVLVLLCCQSSDLTQTASTVVMRGWRLYLRALCIIRWSGGSGNKKCILITCGWIK